MDRVTKAVLITVAVLLVLLLICCFGIILACYFAGCNGCVSAVDDEEKRALLEESPLPKPDEKTLEKMQLAAPPPKLTIEMQPARWSPKKFTKRFKGPMVIHKWQPELLKHDLDEVKPPPQLPKDKLTFDIPANEVYEIGSTVEKLKLDDPVKSKSHGSVFPQPSQDQRTMISAASSTIVDDGKTKTIPSVNSVQQEAKQTQKFL